MPWTKRAPISISWLCGDGADQRGGGEDRQAGEEDAALADQVADPAGQQQQAAEGDHVGVDDPGEVALGEAEVVLDRGQGDVDDRRVEDDHQHPRAEDVEGEPAGAVVAGVWVCVFSLEFMRVETPGVDWKLIGAPSGEAIWEAEALEDGLDALSGRPRTLAS